METKRKNLSLSARSVSVMCFFDGLPCEFCFRCLADLDKPVCSVARCSRFVFARRVRDVDKPLDRRKRRVVVCHG
jgi:hypothetical protein